LTFSLFGVAAVFWANILGKKRVAGNRPASSLCAEQRQWRAKTFFSCTAGAKRIHSPKTSPLKQDSLIFVRCIDYSPRCGEINYPISFD
jgi:hypothetical protein